jgi:isopentenyl-diphosphate delta-isomerase
MIDTSLIPAIAEDGSLHPVDKMDAHRLGILHQAISVFVFSGDELLIQRRAAGKYHCAGQWANSCCTHPHWGEDGQAAANRRLHEELGFSLPLRPTRRLTYAAPVTDGLFEHEQVEVFRGDIVRGAIPFRLNPDEVAAVGWATPTALQRDLQRRPQDFTPWFRIYLARWDELGL